MSKLESFLYYGSIVQPEEGGERSKEEKTIRIFADSSNGRMLPSGGSHWGSSP
jgi:hypothetical protein